MPNSGYNSQPPMPGYNGIGVGGYPMVPSPNYGPQPPYVPQAYNNPPPYNPPPYNPPPYNQPAYNQPPPYNQPAYNQPPYQPPPSVPGYGQMPNQNFGQPYGMQTGYNQGPEKDCEILHRAMHGLGTDENAIINLMKHNFSIFSFI